MHTSRQHRCLQSVHVKKDGKTSMKLGIQEVLIHTHMEDWSPFLRPFQVSVTSGIKYKEVTLLLHGEVYGKVKVGSKVRARSVALRACGL